MIATPAVDLKGGRCVQLVGGRPEDERVSLPDPLAVARSWRERGFQSLHIVDLDAALGDGDNRTVVRGIVEAARIASGPEADTAPAPPLDIQMGGGVRDDDAVNRILRLGVDRVVVGTRAVDDPEWLTATARANPGRITVAADIRDGMVLRKGWTEGSGLSLDDFLATLQPLPLGGILCTDVGREGRMEGIDRDGVAAALEASPHPMWISGGVTTLDELDFLAGAGAAGVVLGMALYTDTLDPEAVAERYGALPLPGAPDSTDGDDG